MDLGHDTKTGNVKCVSNYTKSFEMGYIAVTSVLYSSTLLRHWYVKVVF